MVAEGAATVSVAAGMVGKAGAVVLEDGAVVVAGSGLDGEAVAGEAVAGAFLSVGRLPLLPQHLILENRPLLLQPPIVENRGTLAAAPRLRSRWATAVVRGVGASGCRIPKTTHRRCRLLLLTSTSPPLLSLAFGLISTLGVT